MKLVSIAAWSAFLLAGTAFAQAPDKPGKFYVGLQAGQSELDRAPTAITGDIDNHDFAYTALVGFRFSRFYALELGLSDLGDFPAHFSSGDLGTTSLRNFTVNNVIIWPVDEHLHLKAQVGMNYFEMSGSLTRASSGATTSFSARSGSYNAGLGIGVPINEHLELGLDVTMYRTLSFVFDLVATDEFELVYEANATVIQLGARYRF
jgi:hypothetical protein